MSDLIRLGLTSLDEVQNSSEKKVAKKLIKKGIVRDYRSSTGLFMLSQRSNDDCIFLNEKTRLCTVYDARPEVCRSFPRQGPRPGFCPHSLKNR
jgi:Fe-S-cluster containining protein